MAAHAKSIYVQIDIRAPIDQVWRLTQTPDLHRQCSVGVIAHRVPHSILILLARAGHDR
jgi:hypothetical protein